ncbi:AAA-ATPase [Melia azedarach]|uniref:AAA-ATPase n=1 Tax=Melia azedarach TaxID=155640 RepID=A0ACC1XYM6_MELAZ|nr:AAA-ATPase [Melia azedarach]
MDFDLKKLIMDDLERFLKRKEFYRRVGKAWKRGYLLFGPPGTGKSTLIAAMANYLNFDVYDLELSNLRGNIELRNLLIATENKSILVVEDIDCSIELGDRLAKARAVNFDWSIAGYNQGAQILFHGLVKLALKVALINKLIHMLVDLMYILFFSVQMTLSALLNFMDGLWSSCGDERVIIFTTNHKDGLDPALLRPGCMDMHIQMSYCSPSGFKMLASNYHGITEHPLFAEIEELIEKAKVTPADVAEQLMRNEVPGIALRGLIEHLENKKREHDEREAQEAKDIAAET